MLSAISVESVVENQLPNDLSDVQIIEQMDTTPITPIPSTSSVSDSTPPTVQTKPDYETLFQNYLKTFKDRMTGLNANEKQSEELAKRLEGIYTKIGSNNTTFLKSSQFDTEVVRHHNDLMRELNRFPQKPEKRNAVKDVEMDEKIKSLNEEIEELEEQIIAAESEELDYESMNNNSAFTDLPKLHQKMGELWTKREKLLERSTSTGRHMFKKFRYDSTTHPEINTFVEKLFTNHLKKTMNNTISGYVDESFTFIDVRKAILDEIREKQLVVMNTDIMIQNIYRDLVNEKRIRREKDSEELFETYETMIDLRPESVVDQNDPLLEIQLAKNRKTCNDKMKALFANYATEDRNNNQLKDGRSEWDSDLVNNNEGFESIDVKDGDLEEDNEEEDSDDEKNDENIDANEQIPDFPSNELKEGIKPAINPIINTTLSPIVGPILSPVLNPSLIPVHKLLIKKKSKGRVVDVITIDDEDNDEYYPSDDDDLLNNNEEFESIDDKEGDLEEDNEEEDSDDEKSDENIYYANAPIPGFHSNELKEVVKPEVNPIIYPTLCPNVNPILSQSVKPIIPVLNTSLSPALNSTLNPVLNPSLSPVLKHESEEKPKERLLEVITIDDEDNDEDYPSDDDDIEILDIMTSV